MSVIILDLTEQEEQVLREALECHVEGLRSAFKEATADRTIENIDDLTLVTGSMSEDIRIAERLLEGINVGASS